MPKKTIEQYMTTETVYKDDAGNEIERFTNNDYFWYDTQSEEYLTDDKLASELN